MFYWLNKKTPQSKAKGSLFVFEPTKEKKDQRGELDLDARLTLTVVSKSAPATILSHSHTSEPQAGRKVDLDYGWDGDGRIIAYNPQWYYKTVLLHQDGYMLESEEPTAPCFK